MMYWCLCLSDQVRRTGLRYNLRCSGFKVQQ